MIIAGVDVGRVGVGVIVGRAVWVAARARAISVSITACCMAVAVRSGVGEAAVCVSKKAYSAVTVRSGDGVMVGVELGVSVGAGELVTVGEGVMLGDAVGDGSGVSVGGSAVGVSGVGEGGDSGVSVGSRANSVAAPVLVTVGSIVFSLPWHPARKMSIPSVSSSTRLVRLVTPHLLVELKLYMGAYSLS